ncbi:MAG: hypothetical protein HETSPECPRED_000859 [Heterodermia speciosa]|uniref:Uncharacterized protein n=1 Tax=Heterodermia speciosa TaxID=116794 RepID=A0A8H3ET09_9LECA|nr:MAG: hypothetical protein HETSPECPRED_000859 [Heterodermia speciosa]
MPKLDVTLSDIATDIELVEKVLALKEDIGNDYPEAVDVWKKSVVRKVQDLCDDVESIAYQITLSDLDRIKLLEELIAVDRKVKAHGILECNRISEMIEQLLSLTATD